MASIPLPALAVNPPQVQNPIQGFRDFMAIKSAQQQQQTNALQQTALSQENQQRQVALQAQQTIQQIAPNHVTKDSNGNPTGFDYDGLTNEAVAKGVPPALLANLQTMHKNQVDTVLAQSTADKNLIENQTNLNKQGYEQVEGIKTLTDPQQRQAAYDQSLQWARQNKVDVSRFPAAVPDNNALSALEVSFGMHAQVLADAKEAQATKQSSAATAESEAGTAVKNLELQWGGNPQLQEARYRATLAKLAAKVPVSPDDMAAATAYEASQRKTTSTSDSLGVTSTNTSGPTGLAQFRPPAAGGGGGGAVTPNAKQSIVDLIGNYQADPTLMSRMFIKHPEILGLIRQQYPDFDQTTYNAKNKMMVSYTSGPQSKEINAINTALGHVGVLGNAIDALKNNDLQALNKVANFVGAQTGATPVTTFNTIVHRVGPELAAAYIQGGGGEGERGTTAKDFDAALSPDQLKSNVGITAQLLRSKIGSLENQYKQTVGRDDFQKRFITPEAQSTLSKWSPQSGGGAGGGAQHTIQIGDKKYRYSGSGNTADLTNYTEIK